MLIDDKTNNKKTFAKRESVEFIKNEQKKENEKRLKKILQNNPEIYKLIDEREQFFEENILLGEEIGELKREVKNNNFDILKKQKRVIEQELSILKIRFLELDKIARENFETFKILEEEYKKIGKENKLLKNENNEKRNISGFIKDKALISFLRSENKELKDKMQSIGRNKISDTKIKEMIELYNSGLSYAEISKKIGVGKSTAHKYIQKHLNGSLDFN